MMDTQQHYVEIKTTTGENIKLSVRIQRGSDEPASSPRPAILLCHGFCCIQDILLPGFVQHFIGAGYTAVTFDYRGYGDSEGECGRIVPEEQINDIIAVFDWCQSQPGIDARRIALWGTSLGGCHVVEVAARRTDVKCIISQLAFADGEQLVTGDMGVEEKRRFMATMERMAAKKLQTNRELFVPIVKVMTDEESRVFFEQQAKAFPSLEIKIPYLTVWETIGYKPIKAAAKVTQPTLMVFAEHDKVIALDYGLALYREIGADKNCYIQPNARHYDIFTGEHLNQVAKHQINWLRKYL